MSPGAWLFAITWSLFAMLMIWRHVNLKMFHQQLEDILNEAVQDKLRLEVLPAATKEIKKHLENYLIESKVVDKNVQFRWTEKE